MRSSILARSVSPTRCSTPSCSPFSCQIFLGWFWFIPIFHVTPGTSQTTHFVLERKEIDFSVGAGAWIVDVDVALDWVGDSEVPAVGTADVKATDVSNENLEAVEEAQNEGVKVHDAANVV